jgi:hypothetical protein
MISTVRCLRPTVYMCVLCARVKGVPIEVHIARAHTHIHRHIHIHIHIHIHRHRHRHRHRHTHTHTYTHTRTLAHSSPDRLHTRSLQVRDLLGDVGNQKKSLKVREHRILGPYVEGLTKLAVVDFQTIKRLMEEGNQVCAPITRFGSVAA